MIDSMLLLEREKERRKKSTRDCALSDCRRNSGDRLDELRKKKNENCRYIRFIAVRRNFCLIKFFHGEVSLVLIKGLIKEKKQIKSFILNDCDIVVKLMIEVVLSR